MLIIFFFIFSNVKSYIVNNNWKTLEIYFRNKNLTDQKKLIIQNYVFNNYLPLAYSETKKFMAFHRYKTKFIHKDDLYYYSLIGLYHATRKYNGESNFYKYSTTYIKGSLYKCLTINYPLSKLTKSERRKSKNYSFNFDEIYNLPPKNLYLGKIDSFVKSNNDYNIDFYYHNSVWKKIMNIENERDKKIMCDKFDLEFNKLKSNKELSKKYNCSEETIRKSVYKTINKVTNNTKHNV